MGHDLTLMQELYCGDKKMEQKVHPRRVRFSQVLYLAFFDHKMCNSGDILRAARKLTHLVVKELCCVRFGRHLDFGAISTRQAFVR